MIQTLAEEGDAANYARRMARKHLVMTGGLTDGCSEFEGVAHLAAAAGMQLGHFDFDPSVPARSRMFAINSLQEAFLKQTNPSAVNPIRAR